MLKLNWTQANEAKREKKSLYAKSTHLYKAGI